MNLSGKYELQVLRDKKPIKTIKLHNTISTGFLEYLSQVFAGNETVAPKYVGFGLGNGIGSETAFYSLLQNELVRTSIDTHNNLGTGILVTEKLVSASTLQGAGLSHVTELGVFCTNSLHNEATVSTTINTGTLISRVVVDVELEIGDEFLIKRTDTLTGG